MSHALAFGKVTIKRVRVTAEAHFDPSPEPTAGAAIITLTVVGARRVLVLLALVSRAAPPLFAALYRHKRTRLYWRPAAGTDWLKTCHHACMYAVTGAARSTVAEH